MSRSRIFIFTIVVAATLFFSFLSIPALKVLQRGTLLFFSPLVHSGTTVKKSIGKLGERLRTLDQLDEENKRLLLENKRLQAENDVLHGLQNENNSLHQALGYRERSSFQLIAASVISQDNSTWWNSVKIDRGSSDGIAPDMPVVTEDGLVGKTSLVMPHMSVVLLITDENCKVASKVEGTCEQGITNGLRSSTGELELDFLSKLANLQPGQKVYTAGVSGGIFPSGIQIGLVKSFHLRALDGQAVLDPSADINNLQHVFVIVGAK